MVIETGMPYQRKESMILCSDGSFFVYESAQIFRDFALTIDPMPSWIAWRCQEITEYTNALFANRDKEISLEMRMQVETITWFPADWKKPDVDTTVLLYSENEGVLSGYWDDAEDSWMECTGGAILDVVYWSAPNGPEL